MHVLFVRGLVGVVVVGVLAAVVAGAESDAGSTVDLSAGLIGHWPLAGDGRDRSQSRRHAQPRGAVEWRAAAGERPAAQLDGRGAWLEVPAADLPRLGRGDFTLCAWIDSDPLAPDVPGDIVSWYDPGTRRGFHLTLKTNAGVTTNQANFRQLQFGIDADRAGAWVDCGRPGGALLAFALASHDGSLWAGTCEPGANESGRVYRRAGDAWIDCGAPAGCNAVTALAVHQRKLYAATGKYRLGGSALPESANEQPGGGVYRYEEGRWVDCGTLPQVESVGGLVVFRGRLYATSLYRPAGFFRYEGGSTWTALPTPGKRVEAMGVYDGYLYATSYDGGRVYRYDGSAWTDCGQLGDAAENTQTYSFAVVRGRLLVGTWRSGRVFRFEDIDRWTDVGRLGEELEVMGMVVHNGRLVAGTLPLAEVYEYDGAESWRRLARLDHTPDVQYRRAWTMAEHAGRLYCSTLPSGRVFACEFGKTAMCDRELPGGWHHVAAVKAGGRLRLFVDGRPAAESSPFDPADYDLSHDASLALGFGANDHFCGRLAEVRLYGRALSEQEIVACAQAN